MTFFIKQFFLLRSIGLSTLVVYYSVEGSSTKTEMQHSRDLPQCRRTISMTSLRCVITQLREIATQNGWARISRIITRPCTILHLFISDSSIFRQPTEIPDAAVYVTPLLGTLRGNMVFRPCPWIGWSGTSICNCQPRRIAKAAL